MDADDPNRSDTMHTANATARTGFELRFASLSNASVVLSVPCDAAGRVSLDQLSDHALCHYVYARSAVGREFACPSVQPSVN
jgi:hypothetical protein